MKPLRPFPLPVNIGTDICQISRIYTILSGPRATRFVHRILSHEEQARKDARLHILSQTRENVAWKADNKPLLRDEIEARDPELWKCAAFVAGR